jgi:hypothetical protein
MPAVAWSAEGGFINTAGASSAIQHPAKGSRSTVTTTIGREQQLGQIVIALTI